MLTAFIDESYRSGRPGYYLVSAAVADEQSLRFDDLTKELRKVAARLGVAEIHASEMRRTPEGEQALRDASLRIGAPDSGVAFFATVRAPVHRGEDELARQHCLAHLAKVLLGKEVSSFRFDTRRDRRTARGRHLDKMEQQTIFAVRDQDFPGARCSVSHYPSLHVVGLWIADVSAHLTATSVRTLDEYWFAPLSHKTILLEEARVHPPGEDVTNCVFSNLVPQLPLRLQWAMARARILAPVETQNQALMHHLEHQQEVWRSQGKPLLPDMAPLHEFDDQLGFGN